MLGLSLFPWIQQKRSKMKNDRHRLYKQNMDAMIVGSRPKLDFNSVVAISMLAFASFSSAVTSSA